MFYPSLVRFCACRMILTKLDRNDTDRFSLITSQLHKWAERVKIYIFGMKNLLA